MSKYEMIDVNVATAIVLEQTAQIPKQKETIPLNQCANRYLAEDIEAMEPFPPFEAAVLDGYAFNDHYQSKEQDKGVFSDFYVVGKITAGKEETIVEIEGNQCVYVTTGSKLPKGANTVVGIEKTEPISNSNADNDTPIVRIHGKFNAGANVRQIGKDISIGTKCLRSSVKLRSAEMGVLATLGVSHVKVYKKVKVGIMSTGNELVDYNQHELPEGCIRDANRVALLTLLEEFDAETIDLGSCEDDASLIKVKIQEGLLQCDVMITSGGVSMGSADYLKNILEEMGQVHFGRLNMKPGKPTTFATVDMPQSSVNSLSKVSSERKLLFSLPGNPVSCLVTARLLIQPALKQMYGYEDKQCLHSQVSVQLSSDLKLDPERPEYHRVQLEWEESVQGGRFIAYSQGPQQSSRMLSLVECNGLVLVPKGNGVVERGQYLPCMLISEIHPPRRSVHSTFSQQLVPHPSLHTSVQTCCILTVSSGDNLRDVSSAGAQLASTLIKQGAGLNIDFQVLEMKVLSKPSMQDIQSTLKGWVEMFQPTLVLIVGGCGLKDIVPESIAPLLHKRADVMAHLLNVHASIGSDVPWVATHRTVVGLCGAPDASTTCLVATIPGVMNNSIHPNALFHSVKYLLPLIPRIAQVIH